MASKNGSFEIGQVMSNLTFVCKIPKPMGEPII